MGCFVVVVELSNDGDMGGVQEEGKRCIVRLLLGLVGDVIVIVCSECVLLLLVHSILPLPQANLGRKGHW